MGGHPPERVRPQATRRAEGAVRGPREGPRAPGGERARRHLPPDGHVLRARRAAAQDPRGLRPSGRQLVYYERPDRPGVKESEVLRYEAVDPSVPKERLTGTSTGVVATQFPFA